MSAPASISTCSSSAKSAAGHRSPLLFAGLFFLLVLAHLPLLRLPYYWDEAGYFVPAALDLMRHGWWVPRSTLPNGHPPLLMAWLASVWMVFGCTPLVTRFAMLFCAAGALWGLYRLGEQVIGERASRWAVLLYGMTPLFFAQASLAQLDLPATMFVLWALVFRGRNQSWSYAFAAAAACLSKDTALVTFFALALVDLARLARERASAEVWIRRLGPHLLPAIALAAWYACNHAVTGYWVGNPQYLAYNVGDAAFSLPRILMSLVRRLWQILGYNGTWLLTLLAAAWRGHGLSGRPLHPQTQSVLGTPGLPAIQAPSAATNGPGSPRSSFMGWGHGPQIQTVAPLAWIAGRRFREGRCRAVHRADLLAVISANVIFHSILGGAVLARYLLPALALYILLLTPALVRLGDALAAKGSTWIGRRALLLGCSTFLMVNWIWNPPYPFPYEDNLSYAVFIHLHQQAVGWLEQHPPHGAVLTAWPATGELTDPDLGYGRHPLSVVAVDNFTPRSLQTAESTPPHAGAVLLYSREYRPRFDVVDFLPAWQRWSDRVFQHEPPQPDSVLLNRLGMHRVYFRQMLGQWVEVAEP